MRRIAKMNEFRLMLLDLLAIIHRDGGHRTEELGIRLSYEQAMLLSSERIGENDTLRARVAVLESNRAAAITVIQAAKATKFPSTGAMGVSVTEKQWHVICAALQQEKQDG